MIIYYMLKANDAMGAFNEIKTLCQCVRQSFSGVKWKSAINGLVVEWTWDDIDIMNSRGTPF